MKRAAMLASGLLLSCRDFSDYSSRGDHYEGPITAGNFVRAGLPADLRLCVELDGQALQTAPGTLASSDGWMAPATRLRPLPHVHNDALSLMDFGQGRAKTFVYAATPAGQNDATVFLSLMNDEKLEVRLLRGGPRDDLPNEYVFGVFGLERTPGPCPF